MSITGNIDLLQAINATVTGVGSAPLFADYPLGELEESGLSLPVILTYAGAATWEIRGADYYRVKRTYDLICFGRRRYQEDSTTGKQLVYPILDALVKTYLADATYYPNRTFVLSCDTPIVELDPTSIVDQNESDEWTPIFAGIPYHGWRCSLSVTEEGDIV